MNDDVLLEIEQIKNDRVLKAEEDKHYADLMERKALFLEGLGIHVINEKYGYFPVVSSYRKTTKKFLFFTYQSKDFYSRNNMFFDDMFRHTVDELIKRGEL